MTLTCYHRGCCRGYAPFLSFKGLRVSGINQACKMSEDTGFSMAVAQGRSLSSRPGFFQFQKSSTTLEEAAHLFHPWICLLDTVKESDHSGSHRSTLATYINYRYHASDG